jgi:hypothetical protein
VAFETRQACHKDGGARLGSFWRRLKKFHFHNSLLTLSLCSFLTFENWVRFSFFCPALRASRPEFEIGFVFSVERRRTFSYPFLIAELMFIFALRKLGLFFIFWLATKLFFATEANFSLHRIKNQVGWGGRVFAALRGLGNLLSFQMADGKRVRSMLAEGARLLRNSPQVRNGGVS